jgi:hypothetical protein
MSRYFIYPAQSTTKCGAMSVDCNDPNSVLIFTIVSLRKKEGATQDEIAAQIPSICPSVSWTNEQLTSYIQTAFRRGILVTVQPNTYAVNAGMARVNPSNRKYYCICQLYTS